MEVYLYVVGLSKLPQCLIKVDFYWLYQACDMVPLYGWYRQHFTGITRSIRLPENTNWQITLYAFKCE